MKGKLTKVEFVRRAREVHRDKYDYEGVDYINNSTKVCITCLEHGDFWQTPKSHLKGHGCPSCSKASRRRQVEFYCDHCGKKFYRQAYYSKRNNKHVFCCKECEYEFMKFNNSVESWRGGRISSSTGYKYIRVDGKEIGEHVIVMVKHIGRPLNHDEIVHHIDGNKLNNSLENLKLMTRVEHAKLHNPKSSRISACVRCGQVTTIHGRGLCAKCYAYCLRHKKLNEYELLQEQK